MSEAQTQLGKLIEGEGERDAIHIAVAPMTALHALCPGEEVGIDRISGCASDKAIPKVGIVDPFLKETVLEGQRFFVFLLPNTITGLKHRWTHPAFPEAEVSSPIGVNAEALRTSRAQAQAYVLGVCRAWEGPDYDSLIAAIENDTFEGGSTDEYGDRVGFRIDDEYLSMYGTDAHGSIPDPRRFWDMVEIIVGRQISYRPSYFSCSC